MTITPQSSGSVLDSMLQAAAARNEIGIAVLKKAQDVEQEQGAAMVDLIEQSAVQPDGIDAYA